MFKDKVVRTAVTRNSAQQHVGTQPSQRTRAWLHSVGQMPRCPCARLALSRHPLSAVLRGSPGLGAEEGRVSAGLQGSPGLGLRRDGALSLKAHERASRLSSSGVCSCYVPVQALPLRRSRCPPQALGQEQGLS